MDQQQRQARLAADLEALQALKQASAIFDFSPTGTPPDRYQITFHGRGLCRPMAPLAPLEVIEEHRCELRLPYSYPSRPPDVRWVTPIFHPNVSFSGYINLRDIGLPWEAELGLDVVCERLWDVARFATLNLERASNFAAKSHFQQQTELTLPVDDRPLRGMVFPTHSNLVHYQRRGTPTAPAANQQQAPDVLFIGEDTPPPAAPPQPPRHPRDGADPEVFYIGDE